MTCRATSAASSRRSPGGPSAARSTWVSGCTAAPRSRGSLFRQDDVQYHLPGGGNLRGYDPTTTASSALALNIDLERTLVSRPRAKLFRQVGIALFGDFALADGAFSDTPASTAPRLAGDAGDGIRAAHRIGGTQFVTRFDMPLYVGFETLAHDQKPGKRVAWRWTFSFQPPF